MNQRMASKQREVFIVVLHGIYKQEIMSVQYNLLKSLRVAEDILRAEEDDYHFVAIFLATIAAKEPQNFKAIARVDRFDDDEGASTYTRTTADIGEEVVLTRWLPGQEPPRTRGADTST